MVGGVFAAAAAVGQWRLQKQRLDNLVWQRASRSSSVYRYLRQGSLVPEIFTTTNATAAINVVSLVMLVLLTSGGFLAGGSGDTPHLSEEGLVVPGADDPVVDQEELLSNAKSDSAK